MAPLIEKSSFDLNIPSLNFLAVLRSPVRVAEQVLESRLFLLLLPLLARPILTLLAKVSPLGEAEAS